VLILHARHGHALAWPLVAAAASWGVAAIISKRAVDEIPPLTLLPIQLTVSVIVLRVVIRAAAAGPIRSPLRRRVAALGVLNPGLAYAFSLAGLAQISASVSVLLWAVEPLLIIGLARVVLGDRITRTLGVCSTVALAGVTLVVFQPGAQLTVVGVGLTLAGVAACATYTVLSSDVVADADPLAIVACQQQAALMFALVLFAGSLLTNGTAGIVAVSAAAWVSAVVAGAVYYGIAFWFYLSGLRSVRPAVAGTYINLVPLFGLAASRIVLGESLTGRQWVGAVLIVTAVGAIGTLKATLAAPTPARSR
jgi:probable blue pigment (indigoidine) exporter